MLCIPLIFVTLGTLTFTTLILAAFQLHSYIVLLPCRTAQGLMDYFAVAPNSLRNDAAALLNKGAWYNSGIVFYLEVCLLTQVCRNSDELLRIQPGQPFVCDLGDDNSRDRLAARLERVLAP